ncbi:MAG: lipopolysaccharide heptosyltransferase family protein [Calditrichales bacterium]|nr:MAG: lipopolysaccharide heptosyltransferase family protein [Calditrichales bacterium]
MTSRIHHPIKNILILRPDRLGDVLLTLPTVRNIHTAFPDAKISYLCTKYTAEILRNYTLISDLLLYDPTIKHHHLSGIYQLSKVIADYNYDLAIHLLPRFPLALATFMAGTKYSIGSGYRWFSFLYTNRLYEHRKYNKHHEAEYNLRLAAMAGVSATPSADSYNFFHFPEKTISKVANITKSVFGSAPFIIIHPGSGSSSHDWPQSHFIELIRLLNKKGDYRVGITGTESERTLLKPFESAGIDYVNLLGQFNLEELAVLLKSAKLMVANSTGPLHLAVAMGTLVLGFYPIAPSLGPERWGPFGRPAQEHITPESGEKVENKTGHLIDMSSISPQRVFERIQQILK